MANTDDLTWDDEPAPTPAQAPTEDWSLDDEAVKPAPEIAGPASSDYAAEGFEKSDPERPEVDRRFEIFAKVVPLGVGHHPRFPGKGCLMVGHGAGWRVYVQDILVEKLPELAVPAIRDDQGRSVRFYALRDHLCVRFDTPRATTIYLVIESGKARQVSADEYKLALKERY